MTYIPSRYRGLLALVPIAAGIAEELALGGAVGFTAGTIFLIPLEKRTAKSRDIPHLDYFNG